MKTTHFDPSEVETKEVVYAKETTHDMYTQDTNADPENIDYIIPGNDDALRSINLYKNYFLETIQDATNFQDTTNAKDEDLKETANKDN